MKLSSEPYLNLPWQTRGFVYRKRLTGKGSQKGAGEMEVSEVFLGYPCGIASLHCQHG